MPKVEILLSTYNGDKYLHELLLSLTSQTHTNLTIRIRDDGSSDNTKQIIDKFAEIDNRCVVAYGANLGPAASFFTLLRSASEHADYYAFCDQDDIWVPDKIESAIKLLAECSASDPLLYFCRLEYTDKSLEHICYKDLPTSIGFGNALVQNIAAGCSMLVNKSARKLIIQSDASKFLMHDAWIYLVVSAFGKLVYDKRALIRYRLHESNTIGGNHNFIKRIIGRLKRIANRRKCYLFYEQALEFKKQYYNQLSTYNRLTLDLYILSKSSYIARFKLLFSSCIWRQSIKDDFYLRLLILCNKH